MTNLNNTTNLQQIKDSLPESDIVHRLIKRAERCRDLMTKLSSPTNQVSGISELLELAAAEILELRAAFIESIK